MQIVTDIALVACILSLTFSAFHVCPARSRSFQHLFQQTYYAMNEESLDLKVQKKISHKSRFRHLHVKRQLCGAIALSARRFFYCLL